MPHSDQRSQFRETRVAVILGISIFIGTFATAVHSAESDTPKTWTPSLMMQVKRAGAVQVSPDGKQVAFAVREAVMKDDKSEYLTHIHLANTDGKQARQLTRGDKSCDDPQWSPDGQWIAFVSSRAGKKNLWVIGASGGEAQQL